MNPETVTITQKEYQNLKAAERERDEYRRVSGGKTPAELNETFDRILEGQRQVMDMQEQHRVTIEQMIETLDKAGLFQKK
jgi:DNA-directed RNA polymerase specialized sigma54-like protein